MLINIMKSKIHRATVTEANINYLGSITIDQDLLDAAGIIENEKVEIHNITNGQRLATYAISGTKGTGIVCLNGAAARLAEVGDKIIIIAYGILEKSDALQNKPQVIFVDDNNKITE
ncbi:aspartate 1-decarboxylase [bacterium]